MDIWPRIPYQPGADNIFMGLPYGDWEERGNFMQCYLGSSKPLSAKKESNDNWKIEPPNSEETGISTMNYKKVVKD